MLDLLGRLGKQGDSVTVDGHRLTILRADPTRIRRLRIEPIESPVGAKSTENGAEQTHGAETRE